MSLIVAKKDGHSIMIVSDTRLTFSNTEFKGEEEVVKYGTIKSIIVNAQLCISFATDNNVYQIEVILKKISENLSIEGALAILEDHHKGSSFRDEFILAGGEAPDIYEIKNGEVKRSDFAWIGDVEAFNKFQERRLGHSQQEQYHINCIQIMSDTNSDFNKMSSAIDEVISDETIKSVGGFKVCIEYKDKCFKYSFYMQMYKTPFTIDISSRSPYILGHDSAAFGGYTINFLGSSENYQHLAIHIKQGDFGIVYSKMDNGIMRPQVFTKIDEVDFYDYIVNAFGIIPPFSTQDRYTKYKTEGLDFLNHAQYTDAIRQFDKGTLCDNGKFKAEFLFYKGIALLNSKRVREAFGTFTLSMQANSLYEKKVLQMFEQHIMTILLQSNMLK